MANPGYILGSEKSLEGASKIVHVSKSGPCGSLQSTGGGPVPTIPNPEAPKIAFPKNSSSRSVFSTVRTYRLSPMTAKWLMLLLEKNRSAILKVNEEIKNFIDILSADPVLPVNVADALEEFTYAVGEFRSTTFFLPAEIIPRTRTEIPKEKKEKEETNLVQGDESPKYKDAAVQTDGPDSSANDDEEREKAKTAALVGAEEAYRKFIYTIMSTQWLMDQLEDNLTLVRVFNRDDLQTEAVRASVRKIFTHMYMILKQTGSTIDDGFKSLDETYYGPAIEKLEAYRLDQVSRMTRRERIMDWHHRRMYGLPATGLGQWLFDWLSSSDVVDRAVRRRHAGRPVVGRFAVLSKRLRYCWYGIRYPPVKDEEKEDEKGRRNYAAALKKYEAVLEKSG